MKNEKAIVI